MKVRLICSLSALSVLVSVMTPPANASAWTASTQAEAGYVLDITNTWVLANGSGSPLKLGGALAPGSTIIAKNPTSTAAIVVMLRDGKILGRKCSQQTCAQPLVIPSDITPTSSIFADVRDWVSRIAKDPKRYIGTMARGDQPRDAVILLHDGKADFAPTLGNLDPEVFRLTLTSMGASSNQRSISHIRVKWDGKLGQSIDSTTLMPGLYEARFEGKNYSVWVLLARSNEYPDFERSLTEEWKDVSKQTRMVYWRAELDRLASQGATR
jgi:hypothetical protein